MLAPLAPLARARRLPALAGLTAAAALVLAGCGGDAESDDGATGSDGSASAAETLATASLTGPDGADIGTVQVSEADGGLRVDVEANGLSEGFHGFHVHEIGVCEPDSAAPDDPAETGDFLSAGGHLAGEGAHGGHIGDLPSLQARADGSATLSVVTDAFTLEELTGDDGTAFMVHDGPDNFANIPERYAPDGPDEETLATGDSGVRVACGVVEAG